MDFSKSSEFQQFLTKEKERAMVAEMVSKITNVCWEKCISGTPGNKFSSSETTCLSNCAHRYTDMSLLLMKRFRSTTASSFS